MRRASPRARDRRRARHRRRRRADARGRGLRRHLHLSQQRRRRERCDAPPARRLDLADRAGRRSVRRPRSRRCRRSTCLVQVGGTTYDTLAAMMDQDAAERAMQVNFWSFTRIARAVVRPMTRARAGRIVAIGSVIGLQASQGNAAYAREQGGAARLCAHAGASRPRRRGVTVNYVAPGFVDTDMMAPFAAHRAATEARRPGRTLRPPGGGRRRGRLPRLTAGKLCHRRRDPGRWRPDRLGRRAARLKQRTDPADGQHARAATSRRPRARTGRARRRRPRPGRARCRSASAPSG